MPPHVPIAMAVHHSTTKPAQMQTDSVTVVRNDTGAVIGHAVVQHYTTFGADGEKLSVTQRAQSVTTAVAIERDEYRELKATTITVIADNWRETVQVGPAPTYYTFDVQTE